MQEAIETIVASSAMAILKQEEAKEEAAENPQSSAAKWKRGGIIGAAALTGGTLMAITGGTRLSIFLLVGFLIHCSPCKLITLWMFLIFSLHVFQQV